MNIFKDFVLQWYYYRSRQDELTFFVSILILIMQVIFVKHELKGSVEI